MKNKILILLILIAMVSVALSEVIKCKLASGNIVYQSTPCSSSAVSQNKVDIKKLTPHELEEAQNKLKAWEAQQAADEAARIKAAKELQEEIDRRDTIDALNRNAIAAEQQAIAAQRQAEALERQRIRYNSIYAIPPPRQ